MLQAKTKEQEDFIKKILNHDYPEEYNDFTFWKDGKGVSIDCFLSNEHVELSFDTMAEIVGYLRAQNKEVK